jgi:hypothetical protein
MRQGEPQEQRGMQRGRQVGVGGLTLVADRRREGLKRRDDRVDLRQRALQVLLGSRAVGLPA